MKPWWVRVCFSFKRFWRMRPVCRCHYQIATVITHSVCLQSNLDQRLNLNLMIFNCNSYWPPSGHGYHHPNYITTVRNWSYPKAILGLRDTRFLERWAVFGFVWLLFVGIWCRLAWRSSEGSICLCLTSLRLQLTSPCQLPNCCFPPDCTICVLITLVQQSDIFAQD